MRRLLAFFLMAANAILALALTWSGGRADQTLIAGILYFLLLSGLSLLLLAAGPHGAIAATARGVAAAILVMVGGIVALWIVSLPMGRFGWIQLSRVEFILVAALLVIQFGLLSALRRDPGARLLTRADGVATMISLAAYFTLFYLSGVMENTAGIFLAIPRLRADSVMRTSIPRVQACALSYRHDTGKYPAALGQLGPAPSGSGCLERSYATGRVGQVRLTYTPREDRSGYQILARGTKGPRGEPMMAFGDETGIVRAGKVTDSVTNLPVIHGGMVGLRAVRACAEYVRAVTGAYGARPGGIYALRLKGDEEEDLIRLGCAEHRYPSFDTAQRMGNRGIYTPIEKDGAIVDYVLEIRPRVYGIDGVRSIRTTSHGPVHATVENRPASEADPVVPPCAYDVGDGLCAPEPGGIRPRFEVVFPDSARFDVPVVATVRDLREPATDAVRYQYQAECGRTGIHTDRPSGVYTFSPTVQCVFPRDADMTSSVWMRVWVRDRAGSEVAVRRAIPLARAR